MSMGKKENAISKLSTMVLAIDKSDHSRTALSHALGLAKAFSAKIFAVSVVECNDELEALAPDLVEKMSSDVKKLLDSVKNLSEKDGIECEVIAHTGNDPAQFIVEEAKKRKADMIIMGKHGTRTNVTQFIMGSVTARVLSHAPCNVLVILKSYNEKSV